MLGFIRKLLATDFMPHGTCYRWDPVVLWLNVISDALIALSYYGIPFLMFAFIRRRRDLSFKWTYVACGAFILACGTSHLLGVVTAWIPVYRLDGVVRAITAIASLATFLMLVPLVPVLAGIPSPGALANANRALAIQVEERKAAEAQVRSLNEELEDRVAERTRALEESQGQLLQAQKMDAIGRLAGGVAHDFNNLLTAIIGFNEIVQQAVRDNSAAFEASVQVRNAADRAAGLTRQLLAFGRRQMSQPRILNLSQVVLDVDKMLRRIIGEDIEVDLHLANDLKMVRLDPNQLGQVLLNLAVNARDAMPGGGKLTIETANTEIEGTFAERQLGAPAGPYVVLTVSDTGIGIDPDTQSRIFEPFFTTKTKGDGTGLGLSIVYGIVQQSGGDILVHSKLGEGTTIKLYFPATDSFVDETVGPEIKSGPRTGHATVLLVEDDESVRRLVRNMLVQLGHRVLTASSGQEAIDAASTHNGPIDLLLTDVLMPGMNGAELAAMLKASHPSVRVLFMSGYADSIIGDKGVLSPDTPFLQKPFTSNMLADKIRELIS